MSVFTYVLALAVATEFLFILYIETFATTSPLTQKVFNLQANDLTCHTTQTLLKNQGVYNGLISVLIGAALVYASKTAIIALMLYIIAVAAYGSITSSRSIIFKQGGLAFLCLLSCLL